MHEYFILDAPGGVGRQLNVPVCPVGADGLHEANGADGNQVLQVGPVPIKPSGDIDDQSEIMLYKGLLRCLLSPGQGFNGTFFLFSPQRRREHIAASDVKNPLLFRNQPFLQPTKQIHAIPPSNA